jgi:hypothetical protein
MRRQLFELSRQHDANRRIVELIEAWAPPHAWFLINLGCRLSAAGGLTWVHNDHPAWLLKDDLAKDLHFKNRLHQEIPWLSQENPQSTS